MQIINKMIFLVIVVLFGAMSYAQLAHSYDFRGPSPLADDTGSLSLVEDGTVTVNPDGDAKLHEGDTVMMLGKKDQVAEAALLATV